MAPPAVMEIWNATPDSFFAASRVERGAVARRARAAARAGVAILDVGGESTRPGAEPIPAEEELRRVLPVVEAARDALADFPAEERPALSIDTRKGAVARAALASGCEVVNDVSGGRDRDLLAAVAEAGAGLVLMHMRGEPKTMQDDPRYDDVVEEVAHFLAERAEAAEAAGVLPERIALDPGIGFGKRLQDNLAILAAPARFFALGRPVVLGVSRKSFLGGVGAGETPEDRLAGSLAVEALWTAAARRHGAGLILRAHDGLETLRAVRAAWAVAGAESSVTVAP